MSIVWWEKLIWIETQLHMYLALLGSWESDWVWRCGCWLSPGGSLEMWVLVLAVTRGQSGDVGVGCVEMWVLAVTPGQSGDVGLVLAVIPGAVWRCECWLSPGGSLEMWLLAVTRGQSGDVAVGCHPEAVWRCGIGVSCHPQSDLRGTQSEEALHAVLKKNGVKNIHSTLCVDLWSSLCKSWHLKVGKTSFLTLNNAGMCGTMNCVTLWANQEVKFEVNTRTFSCISIAKKCHTKSANATFFLRSGQLTS